MIYLIVQIIDKVITILIFAIIVRVMLSFFPRVKPNPLITIIYDITDPLLKPFQRFQITSGAMGLDFSPLIAIIVLNLIQSLIVRLLY
ncbi:YGGT family protein [Desulfosporosinus acidiphilus SJ4]|uniref:YGGT family protein n=1 Tax=Desulfosporosinus acidiphilus (strain DSM 22704 / JCM 16185 / SJ4) TaxID=646529 RepID=I4D9Z6_DESAJ|nr:YggT family protein [Desulfosporosinus acidiphilus]AFM42620.1 YGGT family protein [Desulfosporosinus acidiphilus SJ4]